MAKLKDQFAAECRILISRIYYSEHQNEKDRPRDFANSSVEEEKESNKKLSDYINKVRRRSIRAKAYFTLLIFDLVHLIKIDKKSQDIAQKIKVIPAQKRFKRKVQIDVNNFEELLFFFRDAISHPEEKQGEFSPRRSVKYNMLDENMFMQCAFDKKTNDVFARMGDCEIWLLDIKTFLKQI